MISRILSGAIHGVDGYMVTVEADMSNGLPAFEIVGLPDSSIKESKERVRASIKNSGYSFPIKRITINLSPADIKKEGSSFDLPIAVGVLVCINIIPEAAVNNIFIAGELSLDGKINAVKGILPMVHKAYKNGVRKCVVPVDNAGEAALISGIDVIPADNLTQVVGYFNGDNIDVRKTDADGITDGNDSINTVDFSDVHGQENVKRALEIAAAGLHNAIMIGPPGSGKTMLAKRIPTILPNLSFDESLEVTKIYSVAGMLRAGGSLMTRRPFRSPHHTISYAALTGGGRIPKPGEISLSHNGVLFLDELPEFQKNVLEVLRQPIEDRFVTISRVSGNITYPSNFMLISSMNPCPCGFLGESKKCKCSPAEISRYIGKISGPLLDRIDIQVEAPKVGYDDLGGGRKSEPSSEIKKRIVRTHLIQKVRYKDEHIRFNSELNSAQIDKYCYLDANCKNLIKKAFDVMGLSARAYHKILKVARTISDLAESENISAAHLAEAIQYRSLDRKYWN